MSMGSRRKREAVRSAVESSGTKVRWLLEEPPAAAGDRVFREAYPALVRDPLVAGRGCANVLGGSFLLFLRGIPAGEIREGWSEDLVVLSLSYMCCAALFCRVR